MRITSSILERETLSTLQRGERAMRDAHRRVTTGLRIEAASDDPSGAAEVLRADGTLRALKQYQRNVDLAGSRLAAEESTLNQVTDVIERARELAHAALGTATSPGARSALAAEAEALRQQVVQLGNARFAGEYLFGGENSDAAPFAADGSTSAALPPAGARVYEVGPGQVLRAGHDGVEAFVDTGAMAAVQALSTALSDPSGDTAAAARALDAAHTSMQTLFAEIGARAGHLDSAKVNLEAYETQVRALRSDLADVNLEEAITTLVNRQVAYQAALAATARLFETTLTNYLR